MANGFFVSVFDMAYPRKSNIKGSEAKCNSFCLAPFLGWTENSAFCYSLFYIFRFRYVLSNVFFHGFRRH